MPRKRSWAVELADKELYTQITRMLGYGEIWKDITTAFGLPEKKLTTVWKWYDRKKKKSTRFQVQCPPIAQIAPPLPSGGVPPPPPSEVPPPPPPPKGVLAVELPQSDEITEEDYLLKKIEYNTKKSRRRYGSLSQKEESVTSVIELQDLQSELFSRLQTASAVV